MWKTILQRLAWVSAILFIAMPASAHINGHAELAINQVFEHIFASPYHTGILIGILIAVAFIIRHVLIKQQSD